jgi:hypothetical protein
MSDHTNETDADWTTQPGASRNSWTCEICAAQVRKARELELCMECRRQGCYRCVDIDGFCIRCNADYAGSQHGEDTPPPDAELLPTPPPAPPPSTLQLELYKRLHLMGRQQVTDANLRNTSSAANMIWQTMKVNILQTMATTRGFKYWRQDGTKARARLVTRARKLEIKADPGIRWALRRLLASDQDLAASAREASEALAALRVPKGKMPDRETQEFRQAVREAVLLRCCGTANGLDSQETLSQALAAATGSHPAYSMDTTAHHARASWYESAQLSKSRGTCRLNFVHCANGSHTSGPNESGTGTSTANVVYNEQTGPPWTPDWAPGITMPAAATRDAAAETTNMDSWRTAIYRRANMEQARPEWQQAGTTHSHWPVWPTHSRIRRCLASSTFLTGHKMM